MWYTDHYCGTRMTAIISESPAVRHLGYFGGATEDMIPAVVSLQN